MERVIVGNPYRSPLGKKPAPSTTFIKYNNFNTRGSYGTNPVAPRIAAIEKKLIEQNSPATGGRRKSRRHHKSRHHKKRRHTSRRR